MDADDRPVGSPRGLDDASRSGVGMDDASTAMHRHMDLLPGHMEQEDVARLKRVRLNLFEVAGKRPPQS